MEDEGWTVEWPVEPGDYWFYGWDFVVFAEKGSFGGTIIFIHEECLTAKFN